MMDVNKNEIKPSIEASLRKNSKTSLQLLSPTSVFSLMASKPSCIDDKLINS